MLRQTRTTKALAPLVALACAMWASPNAAQTPADVGQITGRVTDEHGSPIAGAAVELSAAAASVKARTTTDQGGRYRLQSIRRGTYTLTVHAAAFADPEPRIVTVTTDSLAVDITLSQKESADRAMGQAPATAGAAREKKPLPNFSVAGAHGSTAPSGYSSGLRTEETAQVKAAALHTPLVELFLGAAKVDCSAEPRLRQEAEQKPASFAANAALGRFYLESGSYAKALPYLEAAQAAKDRPSFNRNSLMDLALAYIAVGRGADAVRVLEPQAGGHDSDAGWLRLMALAYASAGAGEKASATLQKAAAADPSADNQYDCGMELMQLGEAQAARELLRHAIERDGHSSQLWFALGVAEQLTDHKEEAVSALLRAAALDPDSARPLLLLAQMTELPEHDRAELRTRLERRVSTHPQDADAQFAFALVLSRRGQDTAGDDAASREQARAHVMRALDLNPELAPAHFLLGQIDAESNQDAEAIKEFVAGLKTAPNDAEAHYRLSLLYRRTGDADAARAQMETYRALHATPTQGAAADLLTPPPSTRRGCAM